MDQILANLLFAYHNKDADIPHHFEQEAIQEAVEYLQTHYEGSTYTKGFFQYVLDEMEAKVK